jgi:ribosomal protein L31
LIEETHLVRSSTDAELDSLPPRERWRPAALGSFDRLCPGAYAHYRSTNVTITIDVEKEKHPFFQDLTS